MVLLPACTQAYYLRAWYMQSLEEGITALGTGVYGWQWTTVWVLELNLGLLEKHPVLLTSEPHLQPGIYRFFYNEVKENDASFSILSIQLYHQLNKGKSIPTLDRNRIRFSLITAFILSNSLKQNMLF